MDVLSDFLGAFSANLSKKIHCYSSSETHTLRQTVLRKQPHTIYLIGLF